MATLPYFLQTLYKSEEVDNEKFIRTNAVFLLCFGTAGQPLVNLSEKRKLVGYH